ncbi:MAG TPA: 30S ribosomal protein S3, partial [Candidatus Andersenbacteria bacterium]|nr:30S ribosomal protein S3 [Candidatus Andersenbacteria bacterium]
MGRKTNPTVLRVGNVTRSWDSKWFAARRGDYRKSLIDDLAIRRYFLKKLRAASVSRVEIERSSAPARGGQQ